MSTSKIVSIRKVSLLILFTIKERRVIYEKPKIMSQMSCETEIRLRKPNSILYYLQVLDKGRYCKT